MRSLWARFAFLLLIVGSVAASAQRPPGVLNATAGTDGSSIARYTLRFSEPIAPPGSREAPITMKCVLGGEGRWVDASTFVWEFAGPLPGDTRCTATLKPDLKTSQGRLVGGVRIFAIDTGGPFAKAVLPREGDSDIDEDQTFFVATNGPVDRASISFGAYCAVDGIGERIPVDLLSAGTAERVFDELGDSWLLRSFLEDAGVESDVDKTALANVVALKCRRPLPPGRDVSLVWSKAIKSPRGRAAGEERRFDFTVRSEFTARLTCGRVNAQAGCNPVEPFKVQFTAPVPRAQALAVRIEAGGRSFAPEAEGHSATLSGLRFKPPLPPGVTASLVIPAGLKDESGRLLANAERFPLEFEIDQAPPLVKFAAPFGILESRQGGVLPVTVRAVEPALAQSVKTLGGGTSRIEGDDGVIADWVRRVDQAQASRLKEEVVGGKKVTVNHTGDTPLFSRSDDVERMQLALPAGGRDFEVIGIPLTRPGFYVVELASPELGAALLGRKATRYVNAAALVTDMAVHFKWGRAASLVWVTSLDEGKPVAGAAVRVTDSCTGRELARGTTDKFGRVMVPAGLPEPTTSSSCRHGEDQSPPLMISARKGEDFSFVMTNWGEGIRPYDFDLPYGWSKPEPTLHTIMDRALLRAGETIHMKHVFRMPTKFGFRSGGAFEGTLVLQHRGSETSYELPLRLGADGIGESEWTVPKGSPMGDYEIRAKVGEEEIGTGQSFRVDEYRLPTMRATVSGPRTALVRPASLPVDLFVGYLSGGGAMRAPVKLRTAYELLYDNPAGWDGWQFGGRAVREGIVALDEEENELGGVDLPAASTLPLVLDQNGALRTPVDVPMLEQSVRLRVEMDYQDAGGETLTASSSIPIHSSAVRLGIRPDGWLQRDDDLRLKVVALDLEGRIIRRQRVDVALYTREILSARRRLIGGFYAYDNSARVTRIAAHCAGVTDRNGLVMCELNPGVSGEVIAVATTRDSGGNEACAVTSIYLAGDDDWWFGGDNGDRMDIIADARSYKPGDKARIQVRMPFREATALVTVEREGVLSSFVTKLSGKDPVIEVPLAGNAAPDAFISVVAVRGRISNWRVWIAQFARRWNLPILANEDQPTAIVDLAKPAYRIGMTQVRVGWDAHRLKVGVRVEKNQYRVREKARVEVEVKTPDGKVPQSAEVAFAAVDEALLQLEPNGSWDILDAMMAERPLSVLTSTAQMQVVGKRHYGRKALAIGGGGGGDLSALTRADFRPVLLWKGRVPLDARGKAVVEVPMADSLSAYRLVAIATAGEQLFGTGSTEVRTVQDLTIYSGVPPLVRSGDSYVATFTLRNGTDKPLTVTADAKVEPGVRLEGAQIVTIEPGGAMPVSWQVTAPEGIEQLRWTVTARSSNGRSADRIQVDEQVIPAIPVETWAASFLRVDPGLRVPLAAPAGALPARGGIEIALSATPAPELIGVRDYMRRYPFTCFEQRLSKAIALDDRAAWNKQLEDLPLYQAPDGLLRYWPSDSRSGYINLTAYTLSITAEAGWPLPEEAKAEMIKAMRSVVDGRLRYEGQGPADARLMRLAALAALARNGAATPAMFSQIAMPLRDMPTAALADWLVTLDKVRGASPALRAAAETALRSRIVYEGRRLDLVDAKSAPWWMTISDDEMAIKALLAVTGRRGWDQDAPRMMIGAALRQSRGHWDTTPANAWGTLAVRRFASVFPSPTGGVTRASFGTFAFERRWGDAEPMRFPLPSAQTALQLSHSTQPSPWATILIRAAVPLKAPVFSGYRISRQVTFLERHKPNQLSRGDVLKVRITVDAPVDRIWAVIEDPIPAGSSVVSGGGTQSRLLAEQAGGGEGGWPSYIERGFDSWRAYFEWMPQGRTTIEYAVRINNVGRFQLPPTRVEAMYSPEINGALPNQTMVVAP